YCIADMSKYKKGEIGLRWRIEKEVISGKGGGIQSLALAALKNCFLVGGSGVKVVKNFSNGINGRVFM
ncbi:hypothetical protein IFM89_011973, partial [Coptis chinensis]